MSGTYYVSQGGGTAELVDDRVVWVNPPAECPAGPGEPVGPSWGVVGPYRESEADILLRIGLPAQDQYDIDMDNRYY